MKQNRLRLTALNLILGTTSFLGACNKKTTPLRSPPPPAAPAPPTASLSANPNTIEKGQSTTLTWQTSNASAVTIEGIGAVQSDGSQQASPTDSTTYTLTANGPGGTQTVTARVTVTEPPQPPPPSDEEMFSQNVKDIYFDYDNTNIRADQQSTLQKNVSFLSQHPNIHFVVEGHCDERGSTEYNAALGDNRSSAVKNALIQGGISGDTVKTMSYGKEKPFCADATESCWSQNRRGHFVYEK